MRYHSLQGGRAQELAEDLRRRVAWRSTGRTADLSHAIGPALALQIGHAISTGQAWSCHLDRESSGRTNNLTLDCVINKIVEMWGTILCLKMQMVKDSKERS